MFISGKVGLIASHDPTLIPGSPHNLENIYPGHVTGVVGGKELP